tara:strand:+ start:4756 stop:5133 length:378 start_codon:yes stop_codon:yes gene_type:complete
MSTKQIIITQITNFINELCTTYPDKKDMVVFQEKFNMVKGINSQLVIDYFIKYIYPFKDMIMNQNVDFFIDGGGQEELSDKYGLRLRDNLTNLWKNEMNEENKKIVWKYLKTFILLIEKYIRENV